MLKKQVSIHYQQVAFGTWGRFNTPAGVIDFLETKARLGSSSTDAESRLTRFLKPVREALPTRNMDFNQLLQRDLDDHRVATELVPYLLEPSQTGPAFFPPVVAALLPFEGPQPLENFPGKTPVGPTEDEIAFWAGEAFGDAFKVEKIVNPDTSPHQLKVGRLSWNDEKAQLVVIDGQHRAMALLAIFRTINKLWEGQGEKYKHFYESVVQESLKAIPEARREEVFAAIELPVTILWFPEINTERDSHQRAARKLFVDVNKNARPPSESRVLLLSDSDLSAILTRRILNSFRNNDSGGLPISAIEYDHPDKDQAASAKWSAISNVTIINGCVSRAVFGPRKYISNLAAVLRGRENFTEGAKFMHASLRISDVIPAIVEEPDRTIRRENISNTDFPRSHLADIESQFMKSWGLLIVRMLSDLEPFKAHGRAIAELRDGWSGSDSTGRLARDAVFEGVGMYRTLRDSHNHWKETNKIRQQSGQPVLNKTDVVHAWEETEKKREEFEVIRAKYYLGSSNAKAVEASKGSFAVFSTHACQLGFVLAARSLALLGDVEFENLEVFVDKIIAGANAGINGDAPGDFGRKTFLWKGAKPALNQIPKLDTPFAFYFRYFWLELLGSTEARPHIEEVVTKAVLDESIRVARRHYLDKLREIYRVSLRNGNPDWSDEKVEKEASATSRKELFKALKKWFGMSQEQYDAWLSSPREQPEAEADGGQAEDRGPEAEEEDVIMAENTSPASSVEELLEEESEEADG